MGRTTMQKPVGVFKGVEISTIIVRVDLLDEVCRLLDTNQVAYRVGEDTLMIDDEPEVAFVDFNNKSHDPDHIEVLLDGIQ
jgi:hypothetical protein